MMDDALAMRVVSQLETSTLSLEWYADRDFAAADRLQALVDANRKVLAEVGMVQIAQTGKTDDPMGPLG